MSTDVVVKPGSYLAAHVAHSHHSSIKIQGIGKRWCETCSFEVEIAVVVELLAQVVLVPFEVLEQNEAPSLR